MYSQTNAHMIMFGRHADTLPGREEGIIAQGVKAVSYTHLTMSEWSIDTESGRRLKRLPSSSIAAPVICARCWGVYPPRLVKR